jgi:glycosyltransferase involved in cell wall biosynthesis
LPTSKYMQILQVAPYYSPKLGGSPQVVFQISKCLAKRGHKVTILAGDFGFQEANFPENGATKIIFPSISRWGFYITPKIISWCRNHLSEFNVIHLHEVRTFQNIIVHRFAVKRRIPFVLSAHGTLPVIVQRKFAKQFYDFLFGKRLLYHARQHLAVSPEEENQYLEYGIEKEHIRMIYNGLDMDEYSQLPARGEFRKHLGIADNVKIILFLGRLHKRKGIDVLIRAYSKLSKNIGPSALIIAGPDDGSLKELHSLVMSQGLNDQVKFIGPLYGRDKLSAYVDADVQISPGIYEIFGLVPLEAIMCGTPVVVSDDCGLGQIINTAQAGYTVPYGNADALAQTMLHMLSNPEEARQKVEAGQRFIRKNMDWNKITDKLIDLYQECIQ